MDSPDHIFYDRYIERFKDDEISKTAHIIMDKHRHTMRPPNAYIAILSSAKIANKNIMAKRILFFH